MTVRRWIVTQAGEPIAKRWSLPAARDRAMKIAARCIYDGAHELDALVILDPQGTPVETIVPARVRDGLIAAGLLERVPADE